MDKNALYEKIRRNKFFRNNGIVLKGVNLLRPQYVLLDELQDALSSNVSRAEFIDCINYLSESKYIQMRNIQTKEEVVLSDTPIEDIEAKVSPTGVQLVAGVKVDPCIAV